MLVFGKVGFFQISKQPFALADQFVQAPFAGEIFRIGFEVIGNIADAFGNQSNLHGAYILLNGLEYGFSHAHRELIALLIEYSDKKIPKLAPILESHMPPLPQIQWLSFILGLAQCLLKARDLRQKITLECERMGEDIYLHIHSTHPLYLAREYLPRLQKPTPRLFVEIH